MRKINKPLDASPALRPGYLLGVILNGAFRIRGLSFDFVPRQARDFARDGSRDGESVEPKAVVLAPSKDKKIFILVIFMLIGVPVYSNRAYSLSDSFNLRPALRSDNLSEETIEALGREGIREDKAQLEILSIQEAVEELKAFGTKLQNQEIRKRGIELDDEMVARVAMARTIVQDMLRYINTIRLAEEQYLIPARKDEDRERVVLVRKDGEIIGTTLFQITEELLDIGYIVVHPAYWGSGIRGIMHRKAIELARDRNVHRAVMSVNYNNTWMLNAMREGGPLREALSKDGLRVIEEGRSEYVYRYTFEIIDVGALDEATKRIPVGRILRHIKESSLPPTDL